MNLQESIRRILREEYNHDTLLYSIIKITKPLAYMDDKYYYQIVPYNKTKNDKIYINKGSSGHKTISTENIEIIKTSSNLDELTHYLSYLRFQI